jgi:hypothetical protein
MTKYKENDQDGRDVLWQLEQACSLALRLRLPATNAQQERGLMQVLVPRNKRAVRCH